VADAWIGLGSNLGPRREHLRAALSELRRLGHVSQASSLYETEPVGFTEQDAFLNAVVCLSTAVPAQALMEGLLAIEAGRGRIRNMPNGPRTLDLDLLLYDQEIIDLPGLQVPHPRLHQRRFVLVPLHEIAPRLPHPTLKRNVRELLGELHDSSLVVRIEEYPAWAAHDRP